MSDEKPKQPTDEYAELEREIRAERGFSIADAIGRMAGPGMMKGVSPISRMEQAVVEIHLYLSRHLESAADPLSGALLRRVKESDLLLHGYERPLVVLVEYVRKVLGSESLLKELVREADVDWGRMFCERPHFDADGRPPHPDDPYTVESVRIALTRLAARLDEGEA